MNTELPATEIDDSQAVKILNFAFEQGTALITRPGTTKDNSTPSAFGGRITSEFFANFSSGSSYLIVTSTNEVYYRSSANTYTSIKGAASLASDVPWHWKMFNDLAIGANGQTTASAHMNPCKWTGSGNIAQLADGGGTAPRAKYLEVWNNRLWAVSADAPNTLHWSALGDPDNWTAGGGSWEIYADDGENITGIYAHREFLYIFKRSKIYKIVTGEPNTDSTLWSRELIATNIGCVSQWTIQALLDDLIFYSDGGPYSLQAAEAAGDFRIAALAKDVPELTDYPPTSTTPGASFVFEPMSIYGIALRSATSGAENGLLWIMDYKRIREGQVRWAKWDGLAVGNSYAVEVINSVKRLTIGGTDSNRNVYLLDDTVYTDNSGAYTQNLITKAYAMGNPLTIKQYRSFAWAMDNISSTASVTLIMRFDEDDDNAKSYSLTLTSSSSGSTYGGSESPAEWASSTTNRHVVRRRIVGSQGNRGLSQQFAFTVSSAGHAIRIKDLVLEYCIINERRAGTV